jgi:hydrogenase maturation protein HypF
MDKHIRIRIRGIVQGVGFRPFVYQLAQKHCIKGSVRNDTEGVLVYAEGSAEGIDAFCREIRYNPPPLSSIRSITSSQAEKVGYEHFTIERSEISAKRFTFLPPDVAVCEECLREFFCEGDRRYRYPFITCTNCGPRFSIVRDIPYDRSNTSMDKFIMCDPCQHEYGDPLNRRFHTQPNACHTCGPRLSLYSTDGSFMTDEIDDIVSRTLDFLRDGRIIAIKGVGGFLLACDATSDSAVSELRRRKARPFKPFAIMAGSIEKIEEFLHVSHAERDLLRTKERPIVILKEREQYVSRHVAPLLSFQGIMLPYMPFQHLLFARDRDMVLVMTSGNVSDEPIIFRDEDAFTSLGDIADYIVLFDREILAPSDDSVVCVEEGVPFFIRRSRGFVPAPFHSVMTASHILATGGDLKSSFALAKDDVIIMSQYLGDLASPSGNELYRRTIDHFKKVYDFSPEVVVSDMHPGYFTTFFADELEGEGLRREAVQHHHAHIASVIEDRQLNGKVIGLAFDGTGYGVDGTLWGSEFIIADKREFQRVAHFSSFHLPGGESAIRDVWKIGVSLLFNRFGSSLPDIFNHPQLEPVLEIIQKGIHSPLTCSIGRIFDGISSILGLSERISTEAEAAMLLEEAAMRGRGSSIDPFEIPFVRGETIVLKTDELTGYIVDLMRRKQHREDIAYAFHRAIALSAVSVSEIIRDEFGINDIALSGGVFQNRLLLDLILRGLREKKFDIYIPINVPFNDGCIALGQLAVAGEILRDE